MATSRKNGKPTKSGPMRKSPGSTGKGDYYHVEVRSRADFVSFRTQDVGEPGHIQRVAGRRESGGWATVKWLIDKNDAHVTGDHLVGDTSEARDLLNKLGSKPVHKTGDRFEAKPTKNIPERSKPTAAQMRAQRANIKKAQAARSQ